jgi:DNA helicase-2/ATP-dependent DNA helicase PcrA
MSGGDFSGKSDLNDRQREAVGYTEGPLLIVAGAGAGKTKTITHRIAHLIESGVPAHCILAVTFTNKAAGEMRERVRKLLQGRSGMPLLTTFHSLGVRLLREFHEAADLPRNFSIWDRDDSMRALKNILAGFNSDIAPKSVLSTISREKGNGISGGEYAAAASSYREQTVARAWDAYERVLKDEHALDFDDLLFRTLKLLTDKPEILSLLQERWSHITIDEYQDTNRSQYEIVRLLAGKRMNICVVGDTDQNIYSWRGADIEHLLGFEKVFPGAKVVLLEQNYRSTRTILAAANTIIAKNMRRKPKNLFTENETGEPVELYGAQNEMDEAWFVATSVVRLITKGMNPANIAILYRENFQSRVLEEAFLHLNVPYRVLGTRFFERKEVKDVLSYLRASLNPRSRNDIGRVIAVPPRGIGKTTFEKMMREDLSALPGAARMKVEGFFTMLAGIKQAVETASASEAVRFAIEASGIEAWLKKDTEEGADRLGNVMELINLSTKYDSELPPTGIERLLEEAALQSEQDEMDQPAGADVARDRVSLMTVHASKGLEFDAVFVTGLEQGLFPSEREGTDTTRDSEEERRLFYVALTRARKRVFLSYASERMKYGSREHALPSEFVTDIDERLVAYARPGAEEEEVVR